MDDKKIVELKIKQKEVITDNNSVNKNLHSNPIVQKMLNCNLLSERMKFKFKDLFR